LDNDSIAEGLYQKIYRRKDINQIKD
jgi:hypothetical protein